MKHQVKINVSKGREASGSIIRCRNVRLTDRFLRWLTGEKHKVMVLIPGDSVSSVSIQELSEEGERYD